jgi:2-methylisocitrate lyase-like PEP mutase family enzyme
MTDKTTAFHELHASGCFVIPNPWDRGSAMLLARMGFPALATTSAGFAWSMGRPDTGVALEEVVKHLRAITGSVNVPVNADLEGGFAIAPASVANNVTVACTTGISGLSIEDAAPAAARARSPLLDMELSVERIRAARDAIDASGTGILLTARSEGFIVGQPDLGETIRRLVAYAEAGAQCLYAPGLRDAKDIAAVVSAVAPSPVNVLVGSNFTTVAKLAELGVRRVSLGGALARAAWAGFLSAAQEIKEHGTFEGLSGAVPFDEINALFERRATPRPPTE